MKNFIYFDNAATTKISDNAFQAMVPYLTEHFGNASSVYPIADDARNAIEQARSQIADCLNADPMEIYFTSGGTESDNWAILESAKKLQHKGKHIISTKFEHHAVLHTLQRLEKEGFEVTYLDVYENGIVKLEDVEKAIRNDTILITIMFANNEIGTLQPIKEIGNIARKHHILFHTDAVQAVGHVPVDLKDLSVDLLSLSAHKFHGPKGIGALYMKKGVNLPNLINGGAQERNKRAGTENTAAIVGMSVALKEAVAGIPQTTPRLIAMRDRLIKELLDAIPHARLNGDVNNRLPGNVNLSFEFVEGESILLMLSMNGIYASSGSACTSGSLDPSHVLLSIGLKHEVAHGSLRITLSEENTEEEIDKLIELLPGIIDRLRQMSPLYEDFIKGKRKEIK